MVTYTVTEPSESVTRRFSGLLQAAEGASLSFEVAGRVIGVTAKAGERYKRDDELARIDDDDYQSQLTSAQARLTQAEQDLRRVRRLWENGNASQSQYESSEAQELSTRADWRRADKAVRDCVLRMPYDGVIGIVEIEAQQVVAAGQRVMSIQGESGLEFTIGVPAEDVDTLNVNQDAIITLGAYPDLELPAVVSEISPEVSTNTTYPVTLKLADAPSQAQGLRPGLDGEAILRLPNRLGAILTAPASSVVAKPDGGHFVWTVTQTSQDEWTLAQQPVILGTLAIDGHMEIADGLSAGTRVVSRGAQTLTADTPFRVQE